MNPPRDLNKISGHLHIGRNYDSKSGYNLRFNILRFTFLILTQLTAAQAAVRMHVDVAM